ncbi:hypothetical protein AB0I28_32425 [Phytomonospora sp. NPDC050363]|uniref:hypothetical protein n=1 Tax=Phytomonospora sp. NPDC050363 TaxID=3155642 RepID=UPI0033D531D7
MSGAAPPPTRVSAPSGRRARRAVVGAHLDVVFEPYTPGHPGWGPDAGWWHLRQYIPGDRQSLRSLLPGCICGGVATVHRSPRRCRGWHRRRVERYVYDVALGAEHWHTGLPLTPTVHQGLPAPLTGLRLALQVTGDRSQPITVHGGAYHHPRYDIPHALTRHLKAAENAGWITQVKSRISYKHAELRRTSSGDLVLSTFPYSETT